MFTSGRLPRRPPRLDPGLPTSGTGRYEWRGFLPAHKHSHAINPPSGLLVNWNNLSAHGWSAADDNWSLGSIQRAQLLTDAVNRRRRHTLASAVAAANRAATQDLPVTRALPSVLAMLRTGPAPSARAARAVELLKDWLAQGASRLDRDGDDHIDHPGAAILDRAWPRIVDAVMSPVLGPLLARLAELMPPDQNARPLGSAYQVGWYGYVDKDLRTLLGRRVRGPYRTRFCGRGNPAACRASLWAAVDVATAELEATQGPDPSAWRQSALPERATFAPGLIPNTMRWTNRPTFHQAITFARHRPNGTR